MSFNYTSVSFDVSEAFPLAGDADAAATLERGGLARTVLRVLDTLEEGQGHTIGFDRVDDIGHFNPVETAAMRSEGYIVATREISRVKSVNGIDFRSLMGDIADNDRSLSMSHGVGVWSDPDTGDIVLDTAWVVRSRELAEAVGHDHKQHSIYDIINEKEIIL